MYVCGGEAQMAFTLMHQKPFSEKSVEGETPSFAVSLLDFESHISLHGAISVVSSKIIYNIHHGCRQKD